METVVINTTLAPPALSFSLRHVHMWLAGIKKLEMQPPGSEGRRNYETTGVFSPDGEYLPFVAPIVTEGRPEEWLNTVEAAMFAATKKHLYRVLPLPHCC